MDYAVNSSYDEFADEGTRKKAEALLDSKINEISIVNRGRTRVWSIYKDLKQHKGSEIVGKKIEVDSFSKPTETGWNQLN